VPTERSQPRSALPYCRDVLLLSTCTFQGALVLCALRTENAGLREQIRRLESDPVMIEAVARGARPDPTRRTSVRDQADTVKSG
jgi:hypothetical protein